jgi:predicted RNase H-like nuclease (RuvC/YqgF family)
MDGNRKEVEEVYAQIYQREVDGAPIEMILEPIAAYGEVRYKAGTEATEAYTNEQENIIKDLQHEKKQIEARCRELEARIQRLKVAIAEHRLVRWGDLPVENRIDNHLYTALAASAPGKKEESHE